MDNTPEAIFVMIPMVFLTMVVLLSFIHHALLQIRNELRLHNHREEWRDQFHQMPEQERQAR